MRVDVLEALMRGDETPPKQPIPKPLSPFRTLLRFGVARRVYRALRGLRREWEWASYPASEESSADNAAVLLAMSVASHAAMMLW